MPHFEILLDQVQPFDGIDMPVDVRITGTYVDRDNYTVDLVEVPRPEGGRWKALSHLHPLWRGSILTDGIGRIVESDATLTLIDAAIKADMAPDYLEAAE